MVKPASVAAGAASALTRCPRCTASSAAWPPTSPVAPVMKMVLGLAVSMRLGSRAILGDLHWGVTVFPAAQVATSHLPWPPTAGGGRREKAVSARSGILTDRVMVREWNSSSRCFLTSPAAKTELGLVFQSPRGVGWNYERSVNPRGPSVSAPFGLQLFGLTYRERGSRISRPCPWPAQGVVEGLEGLGRHGRSPEKRRTRVLSPDALEPQGQAPG